jgi:phytepsin
MLTAHGASTIGDYIDVSSAGENKPIQNIALTNVWEMQFYGTIAIGTPPQKVTVVFDTGSGEIVVKGKGCKLTGSARGVRGASGGCQGGTPGYESSASSSATPSFAPFYSGYGSGTASGETAYDAITAGGFRADHMFMSVAEKEAPRFSGFKMDGIFGLAQQKSDQGRIVDSFGTMCVKSPGRCSLP